MPQAVPLIISAAAASATAVAATATILGVSVAVAGAGLALAALASSLLVGSYEKNRANKKALAARSASLQDQKITLATADYPRELVYGRVKKGGQIVHRYTSGLNGEFLTIVVKIADTEITAIDDVFVGDQNVGSLDAQGWVTGGSFYASTNEISGGEAIGVPPIAPYTVVLARAGATNIQVVFEDGVSETGNANIAYLNQGPDYSVAGNVLTFSAVHAGKLLTANYKYGEGIACLQVRKYLGAAGQAADATLIAEQADWNANDVGNGLAYVILKFRYHPKVLSQGIGNLSFVVRGRRVFDPRTGLTNYSQNAALCLRDFMLQEFGGALDPSDLNASTFVMAANVCDELVPTKKLINNVETTVNFPRYTVSAVCPASEDFVPQDHIQKFLAAIGGELAWCGDSFRLRPGVYWPPVLNLGDDDFTEGDIEVIGRPPINQVFNAVRGTFVDPDQSFAVHDFAPYISAVYVSEDGGKELTKQFQFDFVPDAGACQRIAKMIMFRARQGATIKATFKMSAFKAQPLDNVTLTLSDYGIINKVFTVRQTEYNTLNGSVTCLLQEDAGAVYSWSFVEQAGIDPAPNTSLPNLRDVGSLQNFAANSGAQYYRILGDATVVAQARVAWLPHGNPNVMQGGRIEIRYRRLYQQDWIALQAFGDATSAIIEPVSPNEKIIIQGRAKNLFGGVSDWVDIYPYTIAPDAPANNNPVRIGVGVNLLSNADFRQQLIGFNTAFFGGAAGDFGTNFSPSFTLGGEGTLFIRQNGSSAGGGGLVNAEPQLRAIKPNDKIEASAYFVAHRCTAQLAITFFDQNGVLFSSSVVGSLSSASADPALRLDQYKRVGGFAIAPAGAAFASVQITKYNTTSGPDSYLFASRLYLGFAHASQTELSPWTAGSPRGALAQIDLANTQNIAANAATDVLSFVNDGPVNAGSLNSGWTDLGALFVSSLVNAKCVITASWTGYALSAGSDSCGEVRCFDSTLGGGVSGSESLPYKSGVLRNSGSLSVGASPSGVIDNSFSFTFDYIAGAPKKFGLYCGYNPLKSNAGAVRNVVFIIEVIKR